MERRVGAVSSSEYRVHDEFFLNGVRYYTQEQLDAAVVAALDDSHDPEGVIYRRGVENGYRTGYGAAMDDGWGEPEHIKAAVAAAEQRVRKEECIAYEEAVVLAEAESFAEGVKAARDAVDGFFRKMDEMQPLERDHRVALEWSLAAIDALVGKP
jgi:hypothetical protein